MKILLDTHIFLWYITADPQLNPDYRDAIKNPTNEVYLSVVSLWEVIIKYQLGKLPLPESPETYIPEQRKLHAISVLEVDEPSVGRLASLPPLHRDPFDRLIISQAVEHGLTLITADAAVRAYPVPAL